MVDQTTLGHRFLKEEFDFVPTVGWQIDPFGHSATQAALLSAEVGFNALFFGRIDYQDRANRILKKEMEMVWRGSKSLGASADVFTGAFLSGNYGPPSGFNWDVHNDGSQPIQDDPRLEDYNVQDRVDAFVAEALSAQSVGIGDDVMFKMGSDFQYEAAHNWYKNLDKLIHYTNLDGRVNAFYSTPDAYARAKHAYQVKWPLKTDDFFPYADCPHCMWTGYFTSRPALKRYVRQHSAYLQTARAVTALSMLPSSILEPLAEAMAVAQHHDAVSGTSKQHVAYDYALRIAKGRAAAAAGSVLPEISDALNAGNSGTDNLTIVLSECPELNVSVCAASAGVGGAGAGSGGDGVVVTAVNAMGRPVRRLLRVPVAGAHVRVTDGQGRPVAGATVVTTPATATRGQGTKTAAPAPYTLLVPTTLPALGYSSFLVAPAAAAAGAGSAGSAPFAAATRGARSCAASAGADVTIANERLSLTFDGETGLLKSMKNIASGVSTAVGQNFYWYRSWEGTQPHQPEPYYQNSGAYIFRANGTTATPVSSSATIETVCAVGVQEVRQTFSPWLSQTVRLVPGAVAAEFEWKVGPVPVLEFEHGMEVISRFDSDIDSGSTFFTDSNGRELMTRVRNERPTWRLNVTEPVTGNYYPVDAAAAIADATRRLTVLTDRAQGGGNLASGSLELMVHRRTLYDDARGVGEPINETQSITAYPNPARIGVGLTVVGTHRVLLDTPAGAAAQWRPLMREVFAESLQLFSQPAPPAALAATLAAGMANGTSVATALPPNLSLMTLEPLAPSATTPKGSARALLRLSHDVAVGEDAVLSQPATVSLSALFAPDRLQLSAAAEVSLTANQAKAGMTAGRLRWATEGSDAPLPPPPAAPVAANGFRVTLNPMQIRTFEITYSR